MRIAIGEMRHLRAVNDVLRALLPAGTAFAPALQPASRLPGKQRGTFDPASFTAATRQAIQNFIDIEAPSMSVDSVYARILATLEREGPHDAEQSVRTIMAEGEDHFEAFRAMQVWLSAHQESEYLRSRSAQRHRLTTRIIRSFRPGIAPFLSNSTEAIRSEIPVAPLISIERAWTWLVRSMRPRRRLRSAASWSSSIP